MGCNFSNCFGRRFPALVQPVKTVKALLDTVIDSCCKYEEVHKDMVIPVTALPGLSELEVGDTLPIEMDGPICCKEVKREEVIVGNPLTQGVFNNNHSPSCAAVHACLNDVGPYNCFDPITCLSTILCMYPVKITDPYNPEDELCQTFNSLNTVELDCTNNSQIDCQNSKVLSVSAVVTSVDPEYVVICVVIGVRLCLRQVEVQEHCLNVGISCGHRCNEVDLLGPCCGGCTGIADDVVNPVPIPMNNCGPCKDKHHPHCYKSHMKKY